MEIVLKDTASLVEAILYYGVFEQFDAITRACRITNNGEEEVVLKDELDVRTLEEEEREAVKEQIREFTAWQFVNEEKSEALACVVMLRARSNPPFIRPQVHGLLEDGLYQINNGEEIMKEER